MNEHHSNNRKIDPLKSLLLDDNTPNDKNRVEIGPTLLARRVGIRWIRTSRPASHAKI